MEEIKEDIEQIKVQLLTGIKLGRVENEWGNMIIETCNRALTIPVVSQQRELLIDFLEMNNWFSLEDRKNAEGVVDCYLKAINCG